MALTSTQKKILRRQITPTKKTKAVEGLIALGLGEWVLGSDGVTQVFRRTPEGMRISMELHRIETMLYTRDSSGRLKRRKFA